MFKSSLSLFVLLFLSLTFQACDKKESGDSHTHADGKTHSHAHSGEHTHSGEKVDLSNEQLKQFAQINKNLMAQRQQIQVKVKGIVNKEGYTMEQFQQLAQKMQNPTDAEKQKSEDRKKFQNVIQAMQSMQSSVQEESKKIITSGGLDLGTYQLISTQLQSNEELRKRFQKLLPTVK